jgi:transcriptional regulator with XRE-family HTH domain
MGRRSRNPPAWVKRESHPKALLLTLATLFGIREEVKAALGAKRGPLLTGGLAMMLRRARTMEAMTIEDVHRRSGLSRSQISYIETGQAENIGIATMQNLAVGYGLPFYVVLLAAMRDGDAIREQARERTRCSNQNAAGRQRKTRRR